MTNDKPTIEEFAEDIRQTPVTGGPDVDLSGPLAQHLHNLGYRKPRTTTTAEELDALPVGSAIGDAAGFLYEKCADFTEPEYPWWATPGEQRRFATKAVSLPATVLHEPEGTGDE